MMKIFLMACIRVCLLLSVLAIVACIFMFIWYMPAQPLLLCKIFLTAVFSSFLALFLQVPFVSEEGIPPSLEE